MGGSSSGGIRAGSSRPAGQAFDRGDMRMRLSDKAKEAGMTLGNVPASRFTGGDILPATARRQTRSARSLRNEVAKLRRQSAAAARAGRPTRAASLFSQASRVGGALRKAERREKRRGLGGRDI